MVNRRSRRARRDAPRLRALLQEHGVDVAAFHMAADHDELRALIAEAADAGAPAIIAAGGDGTMAHAVDALAHRETALGVVPLGTGNSFARSLGIDPHDLGAAVGTIATGRVQHIDLGNVNGTYFANFATIGISSEITRRTSRSAKRWSGAVAYALAAIRPLLRRPAFRARIEWDGGSLRLRTQDIIVANGRYFGAAAIAPHATLRDGRLTLSLNADGSHIGALRTYVALLLGRQADLRGAHVVRAEAFTIRTKPRQRIAVDGSVLEKTPARLRVAPGALRVFVPPSGVAGA